MKLLKKINKKADIKTMESAITMFFIIVIIVMCIVIGYNFYSKYRLSKLDEIRQENTYKTALLISFMPELSCTRLNSFENNCVDIDKIPIIEGNKDYYTDLLGFSNITINVVFPDEREKTIKVYTTIPKKYTKIITSTIPVKIFNASDRYVEGDYYFGYIMIKNYYNDE